MLRHKKSEPFRPQDDIYSRHIDDHESGYDNNSTSREDGGSSTQTTSKLSQIESLLTKKKKGGKKKKSKKSRQNRNKDILIGVLGLALTGFVLNMLWVWYSGGTGGKKSGSGSNWLKNLMKKRLRAGANIDIVAYEDMGKEVLWPGVISEVNKDGTFNVVKVGKGKVIENLSADKVQPYEVYKEGTPVQYEISKGEYTPITIIRFNKDSASKGNEMQGTYTFTYDKVKRKELEKGQAMRMYRYSGSAGGEDGGLFS